MKQLINKHDSRIRLVGLEEAWTEETFKSPEAMGEKATVISYIHFMMPMPRPVMCVWSGQDWELQDYSPASTAPRKKESPEFRVWLRKKIAEKGYSAYGLSQAMGYSSSWMGNFLNGKSRLRERDLPGLAKELGVAESTLRAKRKAELR